MRRGVPRRGASAYFCLCTRPLSPCRSSGPFETRLFINNDFVNSISGKTFPTVNPSNEEVIADVQEALAEDVDVAVAAAKAAFADGQGEFPSLPGAARREFGLVPCSAPVSNRPS